MQQEWATRRKPLTTVLFAVAAICDTIDVLVHLVVVASMTIFHVDHHLLHSIEHFGIYAAICATVSMIVGEIISSYTLAQEKNTASGEQDPEKEQAKPSANLASCLLAGSVAAYLCSQSLGLKPVLTLTDRKSWAWEITAFCFFLKVAQDNKSKVAGFYWAKALVATGIAAFGGGFLAPLLVARSPVPLMEETFAWMLIVAWYVTHNVPIVSDALTEIMNTTAASVMFKFFFNIFKTQQMVGSLELAAKAVAAEQLVPVVRRLDHYRVQQHRLFEQKLDRLHVSLGRFLEKGALTWVCKKVLVAAGVTPRTDHPTRPDDGAIVQKVVAGAKMAKVLPACRVELLVIEAWDGHRLV
jgi:hypothetical protein